jgi:hypothetical protein
VPTPTTKPMAGQLSQLSPPGESKICRFQGIFRFMWALKIIPLEWKFTSIRLAASELVDSTLKFHAVNRTRS